jgi:hypothetical protein
MYLSKTKMNLKEHTILGRGKKQLERNQIPKPQQSSDQKVSTNKENKKTYLTGQQELAVYISGFH